MSLSYPCYINLAPDGQSGVSSQVVEAPIAAVTWPIDIGVEDNNTIMYCMYVSYAHLYYLGCGPAHTFTPRSPCETKILTNLWDDVPSSSPDTFLC